MITAIEILNSSINCLRNDKDIIIKLGLKKINTVKDFLSLHHGQNPSKATNVYWLYARRKNGKYPQATTRSGKWLIFVSLEYVDAVWMKVKYATENGRLGSESKVATVKHNPLAEKRKQKVICVYTYDWADQEDVKRIRRELKMLGVIWKIPYKTDHDTSSGRYRITVNKRISKYYE